MWTIRFLLVCIVLAISAGIIQASETTPQPIVQRPVAFDVSPPLREMAKLPMPPAYNLHRMDVPYSMPVQPGVRAHGADAVEQRSAGNPVSAIIGVNVPAVPDLDQGGNPDQNLAIGDTQVVVWVNSSYAVFDKSTGAEIAGPFLGNSLWNGFGQNCGSFPYPSRDIIVQWDKVHHRWLFAFNLTANPYYICVAVSQSADATGSYYRYQYNAASGTQLPDYPKWGIWTDAYYQTQINFHGLLLTGAYVCAYNSAKLLIGDPSAEQVCFQFSSNDFGLLPGDIDSATPPPSGQDEFFIGGGPFQRATNNMLYLYSMHPDFANPDQSTITGNNASQPIAVANFEETCDGVRYGTTPCVPELNGELLYALGDRLMYRFAYTDDSPGAHVGPTAGTLPRQHWIVSHSVEASGGQAGMRWYEFVAPLHAVRPTDLTVFQQGTYAPDSSWRWMGSAARDKAGDILLGYSLSSASMYPAVAFTGRVPTDPLGTMEGEQIIYQGMGAQINSYGVWGDYSDVQLDADGCTFWYVNEYYPATGMFLFQTRLASIKFNRCQ